MSFFKSISDFLSSAVSVQTYSSLANSVKSDSSVAAVTATNPKPTPSRFASPHNVSAEVKIGVSASAAPTHLPPITDAPPATTTITIPAAKKDESKYTLHQDARESSAVKITSSTTRKAETKKTTAIHTPKNDVETKFSNQTNNQKGLKLKDIII